jgi:hypothetical protein
MLWPPDSLIGAGHAEFYYPREYQSLQSAAENEETKAALRRLLKEQEERRADLDASAQPDQKLDSGPCILGGKGKP